MIVWLNVPFPQKDEARKLGARWDVARKRWFVEDVDSLGPFMQWIDARLKQPVKHKRATSRGIAKPKGRGGDPNLPHMKRIEVWRQQQEEARKLMGEFSEEAVSRRLREL